ncbi:cytochrome aa3 quinol oxidase subunit IV [Salinicoccus halodurans]|uniref:Quinol oxidase subunit 4 n=1 Tax=Salinicoccus halodurans TaxID=407035 RepID=A0A0F7D3Q0_9STAP|nr:cytochrome aa3 quinol oxidase subunit IV [Salinicoccus halodurans]AKG72870.1 cytochrome aa3 quinol oxidase subunit IV [Salinicoccus halodurans]SFK75383.1 cytochrome aa3 quinol oxidase subunit 4 [Salinicoccus halodurans]
MEKKHSKYPINHIVGFALSITLTIIAAWTALSSGLPTMWIIITIMALAVIQAAIQLFMFMHITESGATNAPWNMMFHAFVIAAIIVAGSLFVMSFGFTHDHGGGDHHEGGGSESHEESQEDHEGH